MHFVISWDILASGERWNTINNSLIGVLRPYSWTKPLTTFFVVRVDNQLQWQTILSNLTTTSQGFPENVNFIMSPLMQGGTYNGILPQNMWNEINQRSQM